jgi:hypothetical protein
MNQRSDQRSELLPAPRIAAGEVTRAGEQPAAVIHLTGGELAHLLERAARPVVLQGPQRSPATYDAPPAAGHPGINVTYPSGNYGHTLPVGTAPLPEQPAQTRTWAPLLFIASAAAFLGGPPVAIMTGSDLVAVILCTLGFAGGCRSIAILMSQP